MQITLDWDKWHQSLVHQSFVLLCKRILTSRRNVLILTHEPLITFSLPCALSKGVTEQLGMGTWCLAKANRPERLMMPLAAWVKARSGRHRGGAFPLVLLKPYMECCVLCWAPSCEKDMGILERVQASTMKMLKILEYLSYHDRLREWGLLNPKKEGSRRSHQGIEMYEGRVQRGWSQVQTYSTSLWVILARGSSAT